MSRTTPATPDRRHRSIAVWILSALVALVLVYEGADKFTESRLWTRVFAGIGVGQWFRYATGAIEVAGALLLLIPAATRFAVVLLGGTLIGALFTHALVIGFGPHTGLVLVLLGMLTIVGWKTRA